MSLFPPGVRRALRLPSSSDRLARELDDEVAFHIEQRVRELVARGVSPDEARAEALRRFGDTADLRDYCQSIEVPHMRRMKLSEWLQGWGQDFRFGARQFARSPGFFLIAVATLALGIGASTALFSVVRGVLLRPLPFADPDRIVQVWQVNDGSPRNTFSDPNYEDLRAGSRSFASLAQFSQPADVSVSGAIPAMRARAALVSREFFTTLGVRPVRGRLFTDDEAVENGRRAVLVSHALWQNQLGGAETALGATLLFDRESYTIVGVMPATLDMPAGTDLWVPREMQPRTPSRTAHNWMVVGRLADGVGIAGAQQELTGLARRLEAEHGSGTWMKDVDVVPLHEQIVGRSRATLLALLGGSLLLLLIACANVVNLLIARMAARHGEIALRVALGAGRGRIAQQCLAESLILALGAAVAGIAIAAAGVRLLLALQPDNLPRAGDVRVDAAVMLFAVAIAAVAAISMGLVAAWRGTRGDVREALAQSQRTQGGSQSSERLRRSLVVAQVAMAVVLMVATGLFAHSFVRLLAVDPGFDEERRLVVDISASDSPVERRELIDEMMRRLAALPGVTSVGGTNNVPLGGGNFGNGTFIIMRSVTEQLDMATLPRLMEDAERTGSAEFRVASGSYFRAMGIPVLRGRVFEDRDTPDAPHVAVISESLARQRWPNDDPVGKVIQFGNMDGDLTPFTIVGIVGDVRERSLALDARPTFYASHRQRPNRTGRFNFVMATSGDPAALAAPAQRVIRDMRPDIPPRVRTIDAIISGSVADRRFTLTLVAVFGIGALTLAALGIYSVMSYLVTQRAREFGIRVALGARSQEVVGMVLRQGVTLAAVGILIGAAIAIGGTRVVESTLYGVSATDPIAFIGVIAVLAFVALLASWLPARRAARVRAVEVLRGG